MLKVTLAAQAESIKNDLDRLDLLIDNLTVREAIELSKVYESIGIILKAKLTLLKDRSRLSLVED